MANIKIAQLTNQTAISDNDLLIVETATSTNKMSASAFKMAIGAVVESGSNANGSYTKFGDGTMICWIDKIFTDQSVLAPYNSLFIGNRAWIFPVSFYGDLPAVHVGMALYDTGASWGTVYSKELSWCSIMVLDAFPRNSGNPFKFSATAVGRWR